MCEGSLPREDILSLEKPAVFHGLIRDWDVLKWDIEDWSTILGDGELPFRCSSKVCSLEPVWESNCSTEKMTLKHFANIQKKSKVSQDERKWYYFDYKYIHEWTSPSGEEEDPLHSVKWTKFGFPEIDARSSTLWLGSKGAHTPCHFDTYGSNLVAQVLGSKQWILFPPNETKNMKPTRIPYEESSVYSQWNFNSPLPPCFFDEDREVFILSLNPGDVLYVPRHWWHYVESLDTSVSINTWLPNDSDDVSRLDEALVKFIISQVVKSLSCEEKNSVINPNEGDIDQMPLSSSLNLIQTCVENVRKHLRSHSEASEPPSKKSKTQVLCNPSVVSRTVNSAFVSCSTLQNLKSVTTRKCSCSSFEMHQTLMMKNPFLSMLGKNSSPSNLDSQNVSTNYFKKVVNAICHPDVITKVREKFNESC